MNSRVREYIASTLAVAKDTVNGVREDDCLGLAAEIAYYGLFSLFPFFLFLRSLVPYLPGKEAVVDRLMEALAALVSADSRLYEIVEENVVEQLQAQSTALLSVSVVLTLWGASNGFNILIKALNRAHGIEDTRSWIHRRILALVLTLAAALFIPVAVTSVILGPRFGATVSRLVGVEVLDVVWRISRWPLAIVFLMLAMAIIYYLSPHRPTGREWRWLPPGGVFAVVALIAVSAGFSWFISQSFFELRWLTYGAIGAVIVLLFWFYLLGLAVLIGGEINAAVERHTEGGGGRADTVAAEDCF